MILKLLLIKDIVEKVIIKNDVSIYANNNIDNSILNEGTSILSDMLHKMWVNNNRFF